MRRARSRGPVRGRRARADRRGRVSRGAARHLPRAWLGGRRRAGRPARPPGRVRGHRRWAEIAITLLRSTGLISRNANPYRQDPAGPEMRDPERPDARPVAHGFALLPHAATGPMAASAAAAERYRHALSSAPGSAATEPPWPPRGPVIDALALDGGHVGAVGAPTAGGRVAGGSDREPRGRSAASATVRGDLIEAREVEPARRAGRRFRSPTARSCSSCGPAEIRTVQVRRIETASGRAEVLDAAGPRQNA